MSVFLGKQEEAGSEHESKAVGSFHTGGGRQLRTPRKSPEPHLLPKYPDGDMDVVNNDVDEDESEQWRHLS